MTDTTEPRPGEAEAVEAAAQAEYLDCYMGRPDVPWESLDPDLKRQLRNVVRGGVAVAYPIIFAEGAKAGRTTGGLIPVGMDRHEVAAVLRDILARVEAEDSFEGNLQYLMPDPDAPEGWPSPDADFWVTASYRIGNQQGQGGMRMIGTVPS